jgi:hypothetical protein
MSWKIFRENIKVSGTDILGYYVLKQHKEWFKNARNIR